MTKRQIKPATLVDLHNIDTAIAELKSTRKLLIDAGASKAAEAVARAIKSAEGAGRHAQRRYNTSNLQG